MSDHLLAAYPRTSMLRSTYKVAPLLNGYLIAAGTIKPPDGQAQCCSMPNTRRIAGATTQRQVVQTLPNRQASAPAVG
jgi:hypothetical protein